MKNLTKVFLIFISLLFMSPTVFAVPWKMKSAAPVDKKSDKSEVNVRDVAVTPEQCAGASSCEKSVMGGDLGTAKDINYHFRQIFGKDFDSKASKAIDTTDI